MTIDSLRNVIQQYYENADEYTTTTHPQGHINDSYLIQKVGAAQPIAILQRINHSVFNQPKKVMQNISRVCQHLKTHYPEQQALSLIKTRTGGAFYEDGSGNTWRAYTFIANTHTYDTVPSCDIARAGAEAFGGFISQLANIDMSGIAVTIDHFLCLKDRLRQLHEAMAIDPLHRLEQIKHELRDCEKIARSLLACFQECPLRITHNDTKYNNVLFSSNNQAICVIDYDTVMPGFIQTDFSDALRSAGHQCDEDATDPSTTVLDLKRYAAICEGFVNATVHMLTPTEKKQLAPAAHIMPVMLAIRFYTDFLLGDHYFKVQHPQQNLHRARVQAHLAKDILSKQQVLNDITHAQLLQSIS